MPFIQPTFRVWGSEWGPFINGNLKKSQKNQLFFLFIVTLVLIFIFASLAYKSSQETPPPKCVEREEEPSLYNFFGIGQLIDPKSLMVGMFAGIIFGLIDNGGLWFGIDSLEPLFDPENVPWVYGYGGRRPYSGYNDGSVYEGVKFRDGVLKESELDTTKLCRDIDKEYQRISKQLDGMEPRIREKTKASLVVNEKAFADPRSDLFLGANMTKNDFFKKLSQHKINEDLYSKKIRNYVKYLSNTDIPTTKREAEKMGIITKKQKIIKKKLKESLNNLGSMEWFKSSKKKVLRSEIDKRKTWPGRNKKLVESWITGWRPGQLTNAGIGNTYSDFLGAFLATFSGVIIMNMTQISNVSIISEVIGIVLGCIIGIIIPRFISPKT